MNAQAGGAGTDPFSKAEEEVRAMAGAPWWHASPPQQRAEAVASRMLNRGAEWWLFGAWGRWYRCGLDGHWHPAPPPAGANRQNAQPALPGGGTPPVPPGLVPSGPDLRAGRVASVGLAGEPPTASTVARVQQALITALSVNPPQFPLQDPSFTPGTPSTLAAAWGAMLWCAGTPVVLTEHPLIELFTPYLTVPRDRLRWMVTPGLSQLAGYYTERLMVGDGIAAAHVARVMAEVAAALTDDPAFMPGAAALSAIAGHTMQYVHADMAALRYGPATVAQEWLRRCPPEFALTVLRETTPGDYLRLALSDLAESIGPLGAHPPAPGTNEADVRRTAAAVVAADLQAVPHVLPAVLPWLDPEAARTLQEVMANPGHPLREVWPRDGRLPDRLRSTEPRLLRDLLATSYALALAWCRLAGMNPPVPGFAVPAATAAELNDHVLKKSSAGDLTPWQIIDAARAHMASQRKEAVQATAIAPPIPPAPDAAVPGASAPAAEVSDPLLDAFDLPQAPPDPGATRLAPPVPDPAPASPPAAAPPSAAAPAEATALSPEGVQGRDHGPGPVVPPSPLPPAGPPPAQAAPPWHQASEQPAAPPGGDAAPAPGLPSAASPPWHQPAADPGTSPAAASSSAPPTWQEPPPALAQDAAGGSGAPAPGVRPVPHREEGHAAATWQEPPGAPGQGAAGGSSAPVAGVRSAPDRAEGQAASAGAAAGKESPAPPARDAAAGSRAPAPGVRPVADRGEGYAAATWQESPGGPARGDAGGVSGPATEAPGRGEGHAAGAATWQESPAGGAHAGSGAPKAELRPGPEQGRSAGGGPEWGAAPGGSGEPGDAASRAGHAGGESGLASSGSGRAEPGIAPPEPLPAPTSAERVEPAIQPVLPLPPTAGVPLSAPPAGTPTPALPVPPLDEADAAPPTRRQAPPPRAGAAGPAGPAVPPVPPQPPQPIPANLVPPAPAVGGAAAAGFATPAGPRVVTSFGVSFLCGPDDVGVMLTEVRRRARWALGLREQEVSSASAPALVLLGTPSTGQRRIARMVARALAEGGAGTGRVHSLPARQVLDRGPEGLRPLLAEHSGEVVLVEDLDELLLDSPLGPALASALYRARTEGVTGTALVASCSPERFAAVAQAHPELAADFRAVRLPDLSKPAMRVALLELLAKERALGLDEAAWEVARRDMGRLRGRGGLTGARLIETYLDRAATRHFGQAEDTISATGPGGLRLVSADFEGLAEELEPGLADVKDLAACRNELHALVGLGAVKQAVERMAAEAQVAAARRQAGLPVPETSRHLGFAGDPGTGKATVAHLLAQIYAAIGLLESGHLVQCTPAELAGPGGPVAAVRARTGEALGGVLLIENAAELGGPAARAVLSELTRAMDERRDRLVVVCADRPAALRAMLAAVPALGRRLGEVVDFPAPSDEELTQVFLGFARDQQYVPDEQVLAVLPARIAALRADPGFAAGDTIRHLFEQTLARQSVRIVRDGRAMSTAELTRLTVDDLPS